MIEFRSKSPEQTVEIAKKIAKNCRRGDVFALFGRLGAGKTVFAQGFAKGLCVEDEITSPTYTIINEYSGEIPFFHMDLYRLSGAEDFLQLGGEEYLWGNGVCLIEWSERIDGLLAGDAIRVKIEVNPDNSRTIIVSGGDFEKRQGRTASF